MISARSKALDYQFPQFSEDGISWTNGTLVNVFIPGWSLDTIIDNYVSRWSTDLDAAKFLRISSSGAGVVGHEGNAQIDAIIAHSSVIPEVPEAASFLIWTIGIAVVCYRRRPLVV